MMDPKLVEQFIAIVGAKNALVDDDLIAPYLIEQRGLYHGRSQLVLRPSSTLEVSEILKLAYETATPIVPQGGNTGLVGAQQPDESAKSVIVSLERLNRIRSMMCKETLLWLRQGLFYKTCRKRWIKQGGFFRYL